MAYTGVKFVPNPTGIALVGRSPAMQAGMIARGEAIVEAALGVSPFLEGDYRAGLKVEAGVIGGRAAARVNAHDWKSGLIEFGTSDTPTFAPLRTGVDAAGLKLVPWEAS